MLGLKDPVEVPGPAPLALVNPIDIPAPLPDEVKEERAVKYAMALGDDAPDLDQIMTTLDLPSGEDSLRSTAIDREYRKRKAAVAQVLELNPGAPSEDLHAIADVATGMPSKLTILEKQVAEEVYKRTLASTQNPEEVAEAGATEISQGLYDYLVESETKSLALNKIYEDRKAKNAARNWDQKTEDFLLSAVVPFWSWSIQRNDTLGEKLTSFLPGDNVQEQIQYINGLPTDEAVALVKKIDEEMATQNGMEAEDFLRKLIEGYHPGSQGIDDLVAIGDIAGVAGLVTRPILKKGGSLVSKELAGRARAKKTKEATSDFLKVKEAANTVIPPSTETWRVEAPTPGGVGDINSEQWLKASPAVERLKRTKLALAQPGVKLDGVLAATGHIDEASKILAKRIFKNDSEARKLDLADAAAKTPMLVNPERPFIDMTQGAIARANLIVPKLKKYVDLWIASQGAAKVSRIPSAIEDEFLTKAADELVVEAKQAGVDRAILGQIEKVKSSVSGLNQAYLEVKWGAKDATLFKDKTVAANTAENVYGFTKGSFRITQEGDGYAIRTLHDIDEKEAIRSADFAKDSYLKSKTGFSFLRLVHGQKEHKSDFLKEQSFGFVHGQEARMAYLKAIQEPLQALSKKELRALDRVMRANRSKEKVPGDPSSRGIFHETQSELDMSWIEHNGRIPTDEESLAYWNYVQQNQMQWIEKSIDEMLPKSTAGVTRNEITLAGKDYTFEGKELDHLPVRSSDDAGVWVWTGEKGRYSRLSDPELGPAVTALQKEKGYKIIHVWNPEDAGLKEFLHVSGMANYLVVPNLKKGNLRLDEQLGYNPGGHIKYAPEAMVKQAKFIRDSTGRMVYSGDSAIFGASSEAKGQKLGKLMEKVRLAIKNKDDEALKQALKEGIPMTPSEAKRLFKTKLDINIPISALKSGQSAADHGVVTVNGKRLIDEVDKFDDFTNSPHNLRRQHVQEYSAPRDGPLWTVKEEGPLFSMDEQELVDPLQVHTQAMNDMVKNRYYQDFQIASATAFTREFENLLIDANGKVFDPVVVARNPVYYAMIGGIDGTRIDARVATAVAAQLALRNLVSHQSSFGRAYDHMRARLLDGAYKRWGEKYNPAINTLFPQGGGRRLVDKMRAITFHMKMGFFLPVQMALQAQTLPQIIAISPKHGPAAAMVSWNMRHLDLMPEDPEVLDKIADAVFKGNKSWSRDMFKESWRGLKNSGFDNLTKSYSYTNDIRDYQVFTGAVGKFFDWSPMFFTGTEKVVRGVAWNTAYSEYAGKFPKLIGKMDSNDFKTIGDRAETLALNMTRNGHAPWQEGSTSLMTQFWGYAGRMFDLYTGNSLTGAEKARLIAWNSIAYGIPVGLTPFAPVWPWSDELRSMLIEGGVDINSGAVDVALNGVIASAISGITHALTGEEVQLDIGGRWGPNALTLVHDLLNSPRDENTMDGILKTITGASGTTVWDAVTSSWTVAKDITFTLGGVEGYGINTIAHDVNTGLKSISTYKQAEKLVQSINLGIREMKDGRIQSEDEDWVNTAFYSLTGIERQEVKDMFLKRRILSEDRDRVADLSREAKTYIRLYFKASGDRKAQEEYLARIKTIFDSDEAYLDPKKRQNVWNSVIDEKPYDVETEIKFEEKHPESD